MLHFKHVYVIICSYLCSCYNVREIRENEMTVRPNYVLESGTCFKALPSISYLDCVRHLKDGNYSFNVMVYRRRFLLCRLCFVTKVLQLKRDPGFVLVHNTITDTSQENLALERPTSQSSTYSEDAFGSASSDLAVDGNRQSNMLQSGGFLCAHSGDQLSLDYWWMVNLEHIYPVSKVVVVNRIEACCWSWLHSLIITVGENVNNMHLCADFIGPAGPGQIVEINCMASMLGQFVRISKSIPGPIVICEVEVYR